MCTLIRYCGVISISCFMLLTGCGGGSGGGAQPMPEPTGPTVDLRQVMSGNGFLRVSGTGALGDGRFGVPVAGGYDMDGDGSLDFAKSNMLDSPLGRTRAGSVQLIFGDSQIAQDIDLAMTNSRVLEIFGEGVQEATGGEIWMGDVTGDGLGDLIIGRPNFRAALPDRIGAGALTIVVGNSVLRDMAANNTPLDLASPPANISIVTFVGAFALDRLGFWMRTGDVTGNGIDDILVGADQEDNGGGINSGAAYLIRGSSQLNSNFTIDLANFGTTALAGDILKVLPPAGSDGFHFGATVALADLDGNARSELMVSASLNRVGGQLLAEDAPAGSAEGSGSNIGGTVFIIWDDNVPVGAWSAGLTLTAGSAPMAETRIDGGSVAGQFTNDRFGEEILGGLDYNGDGSADLMLGDISGVALNRTKSGLGHLFFSAENLKDLNFSMGAVPGDLNVTTFYGPEADAISSDTSLHGDFDNDGFDDLALASPTASPLGRAAAGIIHIVWGQSDPWPSVVDFRNGLKPDPSELRITDILGANGEQSTGDRGDTLMYSAASADIDGDGRDDLIVNEMRGNGITADTADVGNLIIIGGATLPK